MWWLMLWALAPPAAAQRPFCDFGTGVASLRDAQARLAAPVPGLMQGRDASLVVAEALDTARARFSACGCPHLADLVDEAARVAEQAGSEASVSSIARTFTQAGFRARLARQALDSTGCR